MDWHAAVRYSYIALRYLCLSSLSLSFSSTDSESDERSRCAPASITASALLGPGRLQPRHEVHKETKIMNSGSTCKDEYCVM